MQIKSFCQFNSFIIWTIKVAIMLFFIIFYNLIFQQIQISMKALILVGGYGTRLRPLTMNYPKSAFPFLNKPMVQHQIQALSKIGVKQIIIAINYQPQLIKHSLSTLQQKYNIKLIYSQQTQALGTAGPLKLAQNILKQNNPQGLFFVFNSDIICDYPLKQLIQFHKQNKGQGSIVLATVEDPSRFGVIVSKQNGQITNFVQKPKQFISNKINAGIYLLNISVLDRIPQGKCMIERQIFPKMAQQSRLYGLSLKSKFWYDIGQPQDYLVGQSAYLQYYNLKYQNSDNVLVDPSATIGQNCKLGPNVVIGPNCIIKSGCRLKNCTILSNTKIGQSCYIDNSIISWKCKIGNWVRIQGLTCIAQQIEIDNELRISQCMICSQKVINSSVSDKIIL